ncbi:MAG: DHCW motif cupin fold protein, partial [bacterium]
MKLVDMPETAIDWSEVAGAVAPGASGAAHARAHRIGDVQLRLVEYGAGYLADHWCAKGHIIHVVAGALVIEHENGTPECMLDAGMSWCVADGEGPAHRVRSATGPR